MQFVKKWKKKKPFNLKSELLLQIKIVAVSLSYNLRTAISTFRPCLRRKNTLNLFVLTLKKGVE